jgi:Fe-S cluster biogenesis protein NfuA
MSVRFEQSNMSANLNDTLPAPICIGGKEQDSQHALTAPAQQRSSTSQNGGSSLAGSDDLHGRTRRIQEVIEKIQAFSNPAARALMQECLESLLALYGDGLSRVLDLASETGVAGRQLTDRLVEDPLLRALLLIHGLHPVDLETRLHQALEKVRPYMQSHGGNVELLKLEGGFARLRLNGACKTCPSSGVTLELAVRKALEEACPDLAGFEVESPK